MTNAQVNKTPSIRPAAPQEAASLSRLAFRSKSHWGYSAEFLEACREELTLSVDFIKTSPVFVLEDGEGCVAGFYGLREAEGAIELLYLFVEPASIKRGYGKLLWAHAVRVAARLGHHQILIESDPHAEAFYLALGARRIGAAASSVERERTLPVLAFTLL